MWDCEPLGRAGEELLGATPPAAAPTGTAGRWAGHGGTARRDLATSTAYPSGRRPSAGFGSWGPEHESSQSKYLKAPWAEDSEGVAGLKWTGGALRSRNDHADVRQAESLSSLNSNRRLTRYHQLQLSRTKLFTS
jgi:hypothetical protein